MRIIALAAIVMAIAGPASAQVIPGIRIGQPKAEAMAIFGNYRPAPIVGNPGAEIAVRSDGHLTFCNGIVTSIQREMGHDLHAFTDTVSDLIDEMGEPTYTPRHFRTADGEISTLGAQWDFDDGTRYEIGIIYSRSGMNVTESIMVIEPTVCSAG